MSRPGRQKKPGSAYDETFVRLLITPFSPGPSYFPHVGPHILLSILFCNTLSFSAKHVMKFHAHSKQMHKIIVLNILILNSLNKALEGKRMRT
jgi:hypothetical protein